MVRAKWRETGEQKAASTNRVVREIPSVEMPIKLKPEKRRGLKRFSGDTRTHLCTHTQTTGTHTHINIHAHMQRCTHAHIHMQYSHTFTCIHTNTHTCRYARIYTHTYTLSFKGIFQG